MEIASNIIVGLVALLHLYFLYFEMFAWTTKGPKIFRSFPKDLFAKTQSMAANQGLYNGFLAAGLIWTFFIDQIEWSNNIRLFFLSCIVIAGIYGAMTVSKRILYVQAIPAILGLTLVLLS